MHRLKILTGISSLLLILCFAPFNIGFIAWFALIPWLEALRKSTSNRQALKQALLLGFIFTIGSFYWVASVLQEFANLPWIVAEIGLFLFAFICQPQFFFLAIPLRWVLIQLENSDSSAINRLVFIVCTSLLYAGTDWILPKLFVDTLGHAFVNSTYLRQNADLGGVHLLTFIAVFCNLTLYSCFRLIRTRSEPSLWPVWKQSKYFIIAFVLLLLSSLVYGKTRLQAVTNWMNQAPSHVNIGVIQANIGDFDKIAAEKGMSAAAAKISEVFTTLSDQALKISPRPDFLVWPETSYPSTFRNPMSPRDLMRDQELERYSRERNISIAFGGYDRAASKDYNAFFFLKPDGKHEVYRKNILLMFGETIPGYDQFEFLQKQFPQVGNFARGVGPSVFELGGIKFGPVICYEILFPDYVIEAAKKGSQLILNITNDSWFGNTSEPEHHLALSQFRSIETRLPQVRSTNTGYSALILPDGSIQKKSELFKAEILSLEVPKLTPLPTLMTIWGDWFGKFAFLAGTLGLLGMVYNRKRAKS